MRFINTIGFLLYPPVISHMHRVRTTFQGKNILIVGASAGIGKALTLELIQAQANLWLVARTESQLKDLCSQAKDAGLNAQYTTVDLRNTQQLEDFCQELRTSEQSLDYLFYVAGKSICRTTLQSLNRLHDFDRTMLVNYRGLIAISLAAFQKLKSSHGQIIYASSVSSLYPSVPGWAAYHASKTAANVWCRTTRREWKTQGVAIKIAYFGLVHTSMTDQNTAYRTLPGYQPIDAARILLRLAQHKRTHYLPWWAYPSIPLAHLLYPVTTSLIQKGPWAP